MSPLLGYVLLSLSLKLVESGQSRYLEGVDEDDDEYLNRKPSDATELPDTIEKQWWRLGRYVDEESLLFDIIQGFLFVACFLLTAWIVWSCFIDLGLWPDHRLDRRRDLRRAKYGRGVFAPVPTSPKDLDDDDRSQESMEYGNSHLNDQFGELDKKQLEANLQRDADNFFARGEKKRNAIKGNPIREPNSSEGSELDDLLGMELVSSPSLDPQTVFV